MERFTLSSWIVLGSSILVTLVVWAGFLLILDESRSHEFHDENEKIILEIKDRLEKYDAVLLGIKGLYVSSDYVSLEELNLFVESQNLKERFPGIQG